MRSIGVEGKEGGQRFLGALAVALAGVLCLSVGDANAISTLWTKSYAGTEPALAVSRDGKYLYACVGDVKKIDASTGTQLSSFGSGCLSVDSALNGFVYVVGWDGISKYSQNGVLQWKKAGRFFDVAVTTDSSAIYAVGRRPSTASSYPMQIRKYAPSGTLLWTKEWLAPGASKSSGRAVTIDNTGFVYISADGTDSSGAGTKGYLLKYDAAGTRKYAISSGYIRDLVAGNDGYLYTANLSFESELCNTGYLGKRLASTGSTVLTKWDTDCKSDYTGIALNRVNGTLFVSGAYWPTYSTGKILVRQYTRAGSVLWGRTWGSGDEYGDSVAVSKDGSIFVGGRDGYSNISIGKFK